ncbi:MAG: sulfurtransferase TusB [Chromatiales bacterium 21-64-14]|nr:MAG: sulfurtransferase TusB [Chromatiales bacterium 21-64-14]HQU15638.1 sulfurtransferase complex subunit TusB [Gammaproteobacteria bacterium]
MTMLHTVNKSPFERRTLDSCLSHAVKGSAILLLEDGVYAALKGSVVADKVKDAAQDFSIYVLGPDVHARGMTDEQVIDGVSVVDYGGFVDLVTSHDNVQSWL